MEWEFGVWIPGAKVSRTSSQEAKHLGHAVGVCRMPYSIYHPDHSSVCETPLCVVCAGVKDFCIAAHHGDTAEIKALLDGGTDVNVRNAVPLLNWIGA